MYVRSLYTNVVYINFVHYKFNFRSFISSEFFINFCMFMVKIRREGINYVILNKVQSNIKLVINGNACRNLREVNAVFAYCSLPDIICFPRKYTIIKRAKIQN